MKAGPFRLRHTLHHTEGVARAPLVKGGAGLLHLHRTARVGGSGESPDSSVNRQKSSCRVLVALVNGVAAAAEIRWVSAALSQGMAIAVVISKFCWLIFRVSLMLA